MSNVLSLKRNKRLLVLIPFLWLISCHVIGSEPFEDPTNHNPSLSALEQELKNTGLTLVVIETVDSIMPSCDYVSPPYGSIGRGIANATKIPGRIVIYDGDRVFDSGNYEEKTSGMTIKIRGNSSAYPEKKPYKISLQKKADLLFRNDDKYADKNWLLIKDSESLTLKNEMSLKPLIGNKMAELIGMEWAASGRYVNLIINGSYQGIYYLTESVKRNPLCRVNVAKDKGYIFEYDAYWWNDEVYFDTKITSCSSRFTFKYPDKEDITEERVTYLKEFLIKIEDALIEGEIPDGIDINSFVTWILAQDILGGDDDGGVNKFFTKYDDCDTSKVKMGPLWDFDGIMKVTGDYPGIHNKMYFEYLWTIDSFREAYINKWHEKRHVINDLVSFLDAYCESAEAQALDKARLYEQEKWGSEYRTVSDNVRFATSYFKERDIWLQHSVDSMELVTTIIPLNKQVNNDIKVDILGRRIINRSGIYIQNGKKFISK